MATMTPKWPIRADHRFLMKLIKLTLDGKVVPLPDEFDRVSRVFSKAGGSWQRVFHGSPEDVDLLKTVLKTAYKYGYLTKTGDWD